MLAPGWGTGTRGGSPPGVKPVSVLVGLINKDALTFFTRLQSLPLRGSNCYVRIMMEIEKYKVNRRMQIRVHAFFYKNKRTIFAIFSVVGVLVSILGTLMSLKKRSTV
jgi:hypothetical protein